MTTLVAYSIAEKNGKNFWTKIGVAFKNKDGSLSVKLDCLPINGQIHIREYVPRDDAPRGRRDKNQDDDIPF